MTPIFWVMKDFRQKRQKSWTNRQNHQNPQSVLLFWGRGGGGDEVLGLNESKVANLRKENTFAIFLKV